jgi:YHS domain-containing protein
MRSRTISTTGAVLMLAILIAPGVRAESVADVYAKITTPGVRADSVGDINQIDGLALHGFDPVAYFSQNKAVKGEPVLTASYQGVTYQFASKEDQAAFQADPAKYVPQYGGFCALATSIGIKADTDPYAFAINDGKLYVNYSDKALQAYQHDIKGNTEKADHNWPAVAKLLKIIR